MTMLLIKKAVRFPFPFVIISFLFCLQILSTVAVGGVTPTLTLNGFDDNHDHESTVSSVGSLVRKEERESLVSTEYGEISAVEISDERRHYHLQFITLEPNALFLPVLLHRDMVFYVHTGSGRLSWVDEDEMKHVNLQRGDVYRLPTGVVFLLQSNLEQERQKLRIYSLFTNSIEDVREPSVGAAAYSSIPDLVLGFDKKTLQAAFNLTEEVIEEIRSGRTPQAIVHAPPKKGSKLWQFEAQFIKALWGSKGNSIFMKALWGSKGNSIFDIPNKKTNTFNILKAKPDFQNGNGRSLIVTKKKLPALKGSNIGLFMVNLTKGSMMGPHWNPMGSEISIVTQGRGIVRVVCSSSISESECKNTRFRVEEGDVFVVPRFHPMAQMAFSDDSLIFMGFSTTTKKNHPQFLVGKASVLQTLDKDIVAASFNVTNTTISHLLAAQGESIILECKSCAEEEESKMEEEIEEEKKEARRREEEAAKKREEEKRREEEEARKREEEEKRRKEEEEAARKREEEEARRREEEEERRREEEEQARRRKEEEARRREEEEAKRREEEEEEEEAKRREEEERRREEEEAKRREEEEQEQEEEASRKEEERRREEEEAKRREEEETREEEASARKEQKKRKKAEKKRRHEAAEREEEEARRREREREEMERQEERGRDDKKRKKPGDMRKRSSNKGKRKRRRVAVAIVRESQKEFSRKSGRFNDLLNLLRTIPI